jgi:hypothetical protein
MPRITPSSGSTIDLSSLEDDEPYKGILKQPKEGWFSKGSAEYGAEDRLTVDWQLEDGDDTIRDWISLRLGKQQNGTVSKLRMLLNALSDKPRDTEVKWFDSDTLEWSYEGDKPFNKITEGMEVVFRGVHGLKQDGNRKFTIQKYQAPKARSTAKVKKADEVPF